MSADFVVHQQVTNHESGTKWLVWVGFEAKARGMTWVRMSCPAEKPLEMWFEGWLVKPEGERPEPWK